MATIRFILQSKKENAPIYLRLSLGRGKDVFRKTGLVINPTDWSTKTKLPKQNNPTNKNIATRLRKLETFVIDKLNDANSNAQAITGDWLFHQIELFFKRIAENKQSELLVDAVQDIIDNAEVRKNAKGGVGLSKSRVGSYKTLKNIISDYQGINNFKVKEVNVKFANTFLKYLLHTKHYQKSYALKKIADLKTVCYGAEMNGIEVNFQLKKIESTKTANENIIYLDFSELKKIANAVLLSEALQNSRKWLLLGCNIGQRGGDLLQLDDSNFVNRNGLNVIELKQQKTGKNITIPVLETTKEILKTGLPYKISSQTFNKHIKEVCKIAKIDEVIKGNLFDTETKRKIESAYLKYKLISSHVCRRSFASNFYTNLPTPLLMQITGHSTEKMFLNYIGKNSLDYAQQIADFYTLQKQKEHKEPQLTIVKNVSNQ